MALQFLDDVDISCESVYDNLVPNRSIPQNVIIKTRKLCSKTFDGLLRIIHTLIGILQQLSNKLVGKIRSMPRMSIVVDKYGYVDVICKASEIINKYYECLLNLYELDAEINKAMSVMDDVKDKLSNSTIRFVKDNESKLQQEIKVKKNFDIIGQYNSELDSILNTILNNPIELSKPKRYTMDSLEKLVKHNLDSKKKQLEGLKYTLDIAKRVYDDRSWIYKKVHAQDISRNRDMINCTSTLLDKIERYKTLYLRLIAEF